ncbi:HEAT repeat domain-containing protein [Streptomyces sp. NPDC054835]|uniref:HEAT repeat domain-containing protein n=1 Tax=Streptomyces sp. NBC_01268 TaxID=2903806 RepID=UPI002E374C12|nr:HEAT repeat domain-containing protein [Streptomyces sp. NBC_01268]
MADEVISPRGSGPSAGDGLFAAFGERIDRQPAADGARPSLAGCRGLLEELARSATVAEAVHRLLRRAVEAGPRHRVAGFDGGSFVLARGSGWSLTLRATAPSLPENLLVTSAADYMLAVPSGARDGGSMECFDRPAGTRPDLLDPAARLTPRGRHPLRPGQVFTLSADSQVARLTPGDTGLVHLVLAAHPHLSYRFAYDRATLGPVRMISTDGTASRLTYTVRLLAACRRPSSLPVLRSLAGHPSHEVRWEAIRAVHRIDPAAGRELLHDATHDPHPEVRQAALQALLPKSQTAVQAPLPKSQAPA